MTPIYCTACPFWVNGCSIEPRYAIGYLKACPNIDSPVIGENGYIMNPPWDEKFILSEGNSPDGHVFLYPEFSPGVGGKGDSTPYNMAYKNRYTIFKNGAGSCDAVTETGSTEPDLYVLAYKKAIAAICEDRRITVSDKVILNSGIREFSRRDATEISEEPVPELDTGPVIPVMLDIDTSGACEQMELF